jgi:hypothetical protein
MILYKMCRCGKHRIWIWRRIPIYRVPVLGPWLRRKRDERFFNHVMGPAIDALARRIDEDLDLIAKHK